MPDDTSLWSTSAEDLARSLGVTDAGLTTAEARSRLARFGPNRLRDEEKSGPLRLLARQFTNPIVILLIGAAVLSGFLGDPADAVIIGAIVLASGLLGFFKPLVAEARQVDAALVKRERLLEGQVAFLELLDDRLEFDDSGLEILDGGVRHREL